MLEKKGPIKNDPSSFSNPGDAVVTDLNLKFDIDFQKKVLCGSVIYEIEVKTLDTECVVFDTKDLKILQVKDSSNGQTLKYTLGDPIPVFGSKLEISLPSSESARHSIEIAFETSPSATGLQWLDPEQTRSKRYPFVSSHCEAIHCRSLIPCQDTPSVKIPFKAQVSAPKELVVLMGAQQVGEPIILEDGEHKRFSFSQKVPIPSYLLAFAAGKLTNKQLGPRSFVWAEEEIIDAAAHEFAETEEMLKTAEDICGPYVWGTYGLLVLPPSFPYGGMENPCLTFVTPTLLAGDRSLADVVAHEIAHSWTGNLVTNCSFEHFWLNEGFTVFVERKIVGQMRGEAHRHFSAIGGLKELSETIKIRGPENPLTKLVLDLRGVDPDDSFSNIPYEKGSTFLFYLETLVGGSEVFDPFLKSYLNKFKYCSVSTDDFISYLKSYFAGKDPQDKALMSVDWNSWLHAPGMPPIIPKYDCSLSDACTALSCRWKKWNSSSSCPFTSQDIKALTSPQKIEFLAQLLEDCATQLTLEKVKKMQEVYDFDSYSNSEIKFRWLRLCIKMHWEEQIERAIQFATEQGRMKFVRPIFRDLYAWDGSRERAIAAYYKNRASMMYVTAHTVATDLGLKE